MNQRIVTTIVALLIFIPVILIGSWPLDIFIAVLALIGMYELTRMRSIHPFSLGALISYLGVAAIVFSHRLSELFIDPLSIYKIPIAVVLLLMIYMLFTKFEFTIDDAALSLLGVLYIGIGFFSFIQLRERSLHLLFLVLFVIWSTDTGAYLIGRKIGKRKLAPSISPNKTVEGSLGGVVTAVVIAGLYLFLIPNDLPLGLTLLLTIVFSIAGQTGDLVESAIKRHYQVKDSGSLLPGHGGVLDRFDSLIFVLNVIYVLGITV